MVKFKVKASEAALIEKIAQRAHRMAKEAGEAYAVQEAAMDVTAAHCNGMALDLHKLMDFDDFHFAHDVFGIRRKINRDTGKLNDKLWLPRSAAKGVKR